ncbi:hypothetical protein SKAU_G00007650 [Synaphobranchus kaupii]|uniref:Uncharacterized protein n=1 Tax=Synaphobranchus kaupii TaxID=118154 RepID=A0A9Q1G9J7_SYNKA|nr:hypothetical protein SKAU_G00007650 [Synaphobranchus kaupii]
MNLKRHSFMMSCLIGPSTLSISDEEKWADRERRPSGNGAGAVARSQTRDTGNARDTYSGIACIPVPSGARLQLLVCAEASGEGDAQALEDMAFALNGSLRCEPQDWESWDAFKINILNIKSPHGVNIRAKTET